MELISFTFAAGETKRFERAGRYIEIIDAAGAIDINLSDANGGAVDYAIGALSGLYLEGKFAGVSMKSATAQTVTLLITEGRGGSRRQPGIVQVVDGGKSRSLAGQAAIGAMLVPSIAAMFSVAQLWNSSAINNLFVKKLFASSPTAGQINVGSHNATVGIVYGTPVSKKLYGIDTSGAQSWSTAATGVAAVPGNGLFNFLVQANAQAIFTFEEPLVIPPGFGLLISHAAVNAQINAGMEYSWERA